MQTDFFGAFGAQINQADIYKARRKELVTRIKEQFSHVSDGVVLLFAAYKMGTERFRQDKTFFYYTGINEPGAVLVIALDGTATVYFPNCFEQRAQWMTLSQELINGDAKALGVDEIRKLGDVCDGYELNPYFSAHEYVNMIELIKNIVGQKGTLFTTVPNNGHEYIYARFTIDHLQKFVPVIQEYVVDISLFIAHSRRHKDVGEVEKIYRAIEITTLAHEAATQAIKDGVLESEVQASLEYMMTASHARPAFPSIVASGKNSTVLHYSDNTGTIKDGDLVLIDIGAELYNYCSDITRTYPVSGTFTKRQRELYALVLETQEYVQKLARPGMWLKNSQYPEKSLHHLAHTFLSNRGYGNYFPHGIGHFLGLDLHDVGDYDEPLHEGDVITIEPGIYIPQEGIGIRIEDNYWITKDATICLSEDIPKTADDIEAVMQQALSGETLAESDEDEDFDYDEDDEEEDDHN